MRYSSDKWVADQMQWISMERHGLKKSTSVVSQDTPEYGTDAIMWRAAHGAQHPWQSQRTTGLRGVRVHYTVYNTWYHITHCHNGHVGRPYEASSGSHPRRTGSEMTVLASSRASMFYDDVVPSLKEYPATASSHSFLQSTSALSLAASKNAPLNFLHTASARARTHRRQSQTERDTRRTCSDCTSRAAGA